ncbi:MAG: acetate/propionate family kinase [Stenomitos frigidus ULC029]
MKILVLNAGSSSQKSGLYELTDDTLSDPQPPLWEAHVDWTQQHVAVKVRTAHGAELEETLPADDRPAIIAQLLHTLWQGQTKVIETLTEIDVVGHRVVHGGRAYLASALVTDEVKAAIARLSVLAPVHNPANLEGMEAVERVLPSTPQVAVFDTAFHAHMPLEAAAYPIPYEWLAEDVRRYGFHGISHQYCTHRAAQLLHTDLTALKLIICHLGNGCSLAAIRDGHSIDTTMGFTPLDGLMMGSRSGAVDPGILIYLLREHGYTGDQLDQMLQQNSGLKGISGVSSDLRQIQAAIAIGNDRAKLAFAMYIHRLRSHIGAMLASLGGLDALVFTAGVGENSAAVRAAACEAFSFLGLKLDLEKNQQSPVDQDIATSDSAVRVLVIHTQEDWAIAQECWKLVRQEGIGS